MNDLSFSWHHSRLQENTHHYNLFGNKALVVDFDGKASATDCNDTATISYTTIASAIAASSPGGIVKVCPGNYPESLTINKTLALLGAQSGVNAANGRTGLPESVISSNAGVTPISLNANNVVVDGFTVQDNTNQSLSGTGIYVTPANTGTQLLNNIVQNNIIGIIPTSETTIRGNLIRNNNNSGAAEGTGIYNETATASNPLTNLVIDGNTFSGNNNSGILMDRTGGTTTSVAISSNKFIGNGNALVFFSVSNLNITGNTFANSTNSQLFLTGVTNSSITCNSIVNGKGNGISFTTDSGSNSTAVALNNNNIYNNAGNGLRVAAGSYTGMLDATNNYWGSPTGPTITSNPGGTGDKIADPSSVVAYNPFLTALSGCAPVITRPSLTIAPSGGTINGTATTFTFTFSAPVTDFTASDITVTGGTKGVFMMVDSSHYTISVTPTSNTITVSVPQNAAFDALGSGNTAASSTVNVRCNNVSIPTGTTTPTNTQFTVPVNVDNTTGQGILAYDFTLTYNPAVVTFVSASTAGTLSNGWTITTNNSSGTLVVSGFNTAPLSGAGVLLNLTFVATGGITTTSGLNFTAFQFNEGVPCVNTTNGDVTVISGTVSGMVTYVNAAGPPTSLPLPVGVPNTTISAAGSIPLSTMTDSNGMYSLSGFGAGAYTITPSKSNQVNGISNLDASRVAQSIVGLVSLNSTQRIAADVSGNGTITSLDAAYIAQFVAGIPNPSFTGTWRFLPANRSYPNVQTSYTGQDYSAILLGEVTGNWSPTGPLRPLLSEQATQSADQERKSNLKEKPEQVVLVNAPVSQTTSSGLNFTIPLTASNTTGEGILGYQFDLIYDSSVIVPQIMPCDNTGTISSGLSVVCNPNTPGILKVVLFGTMPISGLGTLLNLKFNAVGTVGMISPLTLQNFMFNEGVPQNVATSGSVKILGPTAAGASVGGRVLTAKGGSIPQATVTLTGSDGQTRSVMSNLFGNFRFENIPAGETYVINVKSKRYIFAPQVLNLVDSVSDLKFTPSN